MEPTTTNNVTNQWVGKPITRRGHVAIFALFLIALTCGPSVFAQGPEGPVATSVKDKDTPGRPQEEARQAYLGRVIAPPMSHRFADWLTRPEREDEERISRSFTKLGLKSGMVVVDVGCGNGAWSLPIAKTVGQTGKVLAVDIQPEMLNLLNARSQKQKIDNVELILGEVDDPKLPSGTVDLVLMVDVYHEFSYPESMLWSIRRSLNAQGVVALLEFRKEDPDVPIREVHKMSKRQIMKEYQANGFKLVQEYNGLPRQHLMFFARDDSPRPAIKPLATEEVLAQLRQSKAAR